MCDTRLPRSIPSATRCCGSSADSSRSRATTTASGCSSGREAGAWRRRSSPPSSSSATFDVVFAVDSIPAILAITDDAFVVFAANAFALLGLRSLFFLVVGAIGRLPALNVGLGLVLAFVGGAMLVSDWWKVPVWVSLPAIVVLLAALVGVSALRRRRRAKAAPPGVAIGRSTT